MYDPSLQVFFFSLNSQLFWIFLLRKSDISISGKHIYPFPGPVLINQIWADVCYSGTRQTVDSMSKATNKKFRKYLIELIRRGRGNHILNACIYFASSSLWYEVIGLQIYGCPMTEAQGLRNLPGLKKKILQDISREAIEVQRHSYSQWLDELRSITELYQF